MFITAVKIALVEALNAGFAALGEKTNSYTTDLTPNSITIDYPMTEVQWPAIFLQFRPSKVQWSGMWPDELTTRIGAFIDGGPAVISSRTGYFEGSIDLQILALHSEERDRLWDSIYNLILMNPNSPGSAAFYNSLNNNDLVGITLLPSVVQTMGDTIAPGTPFSPEELTYEASIRIPCVGDFYEGKYDYFLPTISEVTVSGQVTEGPIIYDEPRIDPFTITNYDPGVNPITIS